MKLSTARLTTTILTIIGFIFFVGAELLGVPGIILPGVIIGIAFIFAGIVFGLIFIRCPYCNGSLYIRSLTPQYCPRCGKEVTKKN